MQVLVSYEYPEKSSGYWRIAADILHFYGIFLQNAVVPLRVIKKLSFEFRLKLCIEIDHKENSLL